MRLSPLLLLATVSASCLDRPDEDIVPLAVLLGDPDNAPFVDSLPDYSTRVDQFTRRADYLRGFVGGRAIWYWAVDGANSELIAPTFFIIDAAAQRQQAPIIDVLPGDPGYTPWWRVIEYEVTDRWNGEIFTSRAAVDAGQRAGLLSGPDVTDRILNAPVSVPNVRVDDGEQIRVRTSTIWYRGARAHWIAFNQNVRVPVDERRMRSRPVYIFQRINEAIPLYELGSGVDLNGDGVLDSSNNVFAADLTDDDYTPLWYRADVRTTADYLSIDSDPPLVGLSGEDQFYDRRGARILSSNVLSVELFPEALVNCPIQSERGQLR